MRIYKKHANGKNLVLIWIDEWVGDVLSTFYNRSVRFYILSGNMVANEGTVVVPVN